MRSSLSRRSFLRSAALGSAALTLGSRLAAQPAKLPRKANLLVFLPDQQRTDTIACYGGVRVHAPNLNKLASESVVFERAYVTHPICTPSRSSLMTGTWPHTNGCTRNNMLLDARYLALPELIADPDYRTGYMGKWHLGDEMFAQRGFEEWVSTEDTPHSVSKGRAPRALSDYGKFLVSKNLKPDKRTALSVESFQASSPSNCRSRGFWKRTPAISSSDTGANRSCSSSPFSSRIRLITGH